MTTKQSHRGPVPPLPPVTAPAWIMTQARRNCAAVAREKFGNDLANSYLRGEQDQGFGMRFEVMKLMGSDENGR